MAKSSSGRHGGSGRTPMTAQAASRIQSAGAKHSGSKTANTGFAPRAQSAAARNDTPSGPIPRAR